MTAATPAVSLKGLRKRFGDLEVLKGISLDAAEGDVISILGARGGLAQGRRARCPAPDHSPGRPTCRDIGWAGRAGKCTTA